MKRGDLYLVRKPGPVGSSADPRRQRVFFVVSRQTLIETRFSSVICAPIYSRHDGLSTQIPVGPEEGLKHASSIHCDELVSLPKGLLTDFVGSLGESKIEELNRALQRSLDLEVAS